MNISGLGRVSRLKPAQNWRFFRVSGHTLWRRRRCPECFTSHEIETITGGNEEDRIMPKTKVFVSYDFDNDKVLKDFIIGQAKLADSPFEVSDHSLKEAAPERDWETKARAAISRADKFI